MYAGREIDPKTEINYLEGKWLDWQLEDKQEYLYHGRNLMRSDRYRKGFIFTYQDHSNYYYHDHLGSVRMSIQDYGWGWMWNGSTGDTLSQSKGSPQGNGNHNGWANGNNGNHNGWSEEDWNNGRHLGWHGWYGWHGWGIHNGHGYWHNGHVRKYSYDVWGNNAHWFNFAFNTPDVGYTGKHFDSFTRTYNYGYRRYSPFRKQFMTEDPIRDGYNWYAYTAHIADPVNWLDLDGLKIVVAGSPAFEGVVDGGVGTHVYVTSTEDEENYRGRNGSYDDLLEDPNPDSNYGGGNGPSVDPYVEINQGDMTDEEYMEAIKKYPGWESGPYLPWINDCHNSLDRALDFMEEKYGIKKDYEDWETGRTWYDDDFISSVKDTINDIAQTIQDTINDIINGDKTGGKNE